VVHYGADPRNIHVLACMSSESVNNCRKRHEEPLHSQDLAPARNEPALRFVMQGTVTNRTRRFEAATLIHLPAAYNLARWLLRDAQQAEDAVQEA
jgi:hypothetical protein